MASGSELVAGVEGAGERSLAVAVLLSTQAGADTLGPAAGGSGWVGDGSGTTAAQLFTLRSSTSNTNAESGPMSRPAPRLP